MSDSPAEPSNGFPALIVALAAVVVPFLTMAVVGRVIGPSAGTEIPVVEAGPEKCLDCHAPIQQSGTHVRHGFDSFGCVSCHNGIGSQSGQDAAHGMPQVDDANRLIPYNYLFSACVVCHEPGSGGNDARLGQVASAAVLYRDLGCGGCHDSGLIAPDWKTVGMMRDLQPVGANPARYFKLAEGNPRIAFHAESIAEPDVNLPPEVIAARDTRHGPAPSRMPDLRLADDPLILLAGYTYGLSRTVKGPRPGGANGGASDGKTIYEQKGCAACHRLKGQGGEAGPALDGAAARGADWIRHETVTPNESLTPGYPPIMPDDYGKQLTPQEIEAIVDYLLHASR